MWWVPRLLCVYVIQTSYMIHLIEGAPSCKDSQIVLWRPYVVGSKAPLRLRNTDLLHDTPNRRAASCKDSQIVPISGGHMWWVPRLLCVYVIQTSYMIHLIEGAPSCKDSQIVLWRPYVVGSKAPEASYNIFCVYVIQTSYMIHLIEGAPS